MVTATWNGAVIAECDDTKIVEGNHYFPADSVKQAYLEASDTRTVCPWKGEASYFTIRIGGETNVDAAWTYKDPKPDAAQIKDHIAFWKGVRVDAG
jgi:uncharacterized protein (DUF427 family)